MKKESNAQIRTIESPGSRWSELSIELSSENHESLFHNRKTELERPEGLNFPPRLVTHELTSQNVDKSSGVFEAPLQ